MNFNVLKKKYKQNGWKFILGGACILLFIIVVIQRTESGTYDLELDLKNVVKNKTIKDVSTVQLSNGKQSKGEKECRRVLEKIFDKPFVNCRPSFLFNTITNENLEIDCFNDSLALGVEYNGIQHYKHIPFFHKTKQEFKFQKYRDEMKKHLCTKHNVILITVPYTVKNIEKFLRNELREYGFID
jgi:hypothetical protein